MGEAWVRARAGGEDARAYGGEDGVVGQKGPVLVHSDLYVDLVTKGY